jgi:O-antigen/teichoic acid export membrane protein
MASNRLILIASQATGQLSLVLAAPFLTRLFDPGELGGYHLAISIGGLLQPFLTLRYESLIPSEKTEAAIPQYLRHIATASVVVTAMLSLLALLGAFVFSASFVNAVVMAAVIAISYSLTAVDNALLIRQKEMNRLAVRNFLTGVLVATLQVGLAYLLRDVIWIAIAILIGRLSAILITRKVGENRVRSVIGSEEVRIDWGRTLYRISAQLVHSLTLNTMVLYSQVSFGPSATAYVGMAQRSASAPLGLISQALSQSVQATIGEAVRLGDTALRRHVHRQMRSLLPYSVATTLGLIVLGPLLAEPVFGSGWETTGQIIAVLGVPAGLQLLIAPITSVFHMLGADRRLFRAQLLRFLLSVLLAVTFKLVFDDLVLTIAGYSLGNSLGYIYMYVALKETIGKVYPG